MRALLQILADALTHAGPERPLLVNLEEAIPDHPDRLDSRLPSVPLLGCCHPKVIAIMLVYRG